MVVLYIASAAAGIGFGLMQAWWTKKMVAAQDQKGRAALMIAAKLALWALVMVSLALWNTTMLLCFAAASGLSMITANIVLWRKAQRGGNKT